MQCCQLRSMRSKLILVECHSESAHGVKGGLRVMPTAALAAAAKAEPMLIRGMGVAAEPRALLSSCTCRPQHALSDKSTGKWCIWHHQRAKIDKCAREVRG